MDWSGGVGGHQGTLAEFVAVNTELLALKPKALSMREAAALPLIAITAWEGIVDRAKVQVGQKVLVHAGAGGVGQIAVQLAKAFGAEVFATVSPAKKHIVEEMGAVPIDYTSLSTEQYVELHTQGQGFDVVYDTVGGATIDASFVAVKRYTGHVVSCLGWSTHSLASALVPGRHLLGCLHAYAPADWLWAAAPRRDPARCSQTPADAGKLKPLLYPRQFSATPDDLAEAYTLVESGALGKVVIDIA